MPKVIVNKHTLETLPDTPENRKQTYRVECEGDYKRYSEKYETITYGDCFGRSSMALLEKYGLVEAHKEHCRNVRALEVEREREAQANMREAVALLSKEQLAVSLLELYSALDSHTQAEALEAIESYKDDARWCDSYR